MWRCSSVTVSTERQHGEREERQHCGVVRRRAPLPQKTGNGFARRGGRLLQRVCGVTRPVLLCSPPMLVASIEVRTGHVCPRPREQVCCKPTSRAHPYFSQESVSPPRTVLLGPVFGSVVPTLPLLFSKGTAGAVLLSRRLRSDLHRDLIPCDTITLGRQATHQMLGAVPGQPITRSAVLDIGCRSVVVRE